MRPVSVTTERDKSRFEMNLAVVFVPRMSQLAEQGSVGKQTWPYKADEWADKDKSLLEMNPVIARSACPTWQSIEAWGSRRMSQLAEQGSVGEADMAVQG